MNRLLAGIGKLDRSRLTHVLRHTHDTVSISEAAHILDCPRANAAKILARWTVKGWMCRVKRGLYIPVPLTSTTGDIALEDPWIIAEKIYQPCYIGGWSAGEHWGLTEQLFRTIIVLTTKTLRDRKPNIQGTPFLIRTIPAKNLFGCKTVWRGTTKILISDPSRTILDFLIDPSLGGGIRTVVDMWVDYLKSEHKNLDLLLTYARRLNNKAVFKRLGFLLEEHASQETDALNVCKNQLTISTTKLDPHLASRKLITRWRLWIPDNWGK